jgi:ABC-type antimicrobial peptide transport system permease subunit
VSRRISELGLRLALGAARTHVLWLVLRDALVLVLIGGLIGLPLTYAAARALRSLLYTVPPMDPLAYVAGAALLVVVAAAAAYLPARRASRVEPLVALGRN